MFSYISSRFKMCQAEIDNVDNKLRFAYEFPLARHTLTNEMPPLPLPEVIEWLNECPEGRWSYIFDLGDIWGVSFEKEEDAIHFKMRWL
jgi:hypothetical protein